MDFTTNETLPVAIREKFELTQPLRGGPKFAFPAHGGITVDFSTIDEKTVLYLIGRGWPGIRRKKPAPAPKAAPKPDISEAPARDITDTKQ